MFFHKIKRPMLLLASVLFFSVLLLSGDIIDKAGVAGLSFALLAATFILMDLLTLNNILSRRFWPLKHLWLQEIPED